MNYELRTSCFSVIKINFDQIILGKKSIRHHQRTLNNQCGFSFHIKHKNNLKLFLLVFGKIFKALDYIINLQRSQTNNQMPPLNFLLGLHSNNQNEDIWFNLRLQSVDTKQDRQFRLTVLSISLPLSALVLVIIL